MIVTLSSNLDLSDHIGSVYTFYSEPGGMNVFERQGEQDVFLGSVDADGRTFPITTGIIKVTTYEESRLIYHEGEPVKILLSVDATYENVTLSWTSNQTTGHIVERSSDDMVWSTIATTNDSSFVDTVVTPGQRLSYRIKPVQSINDTSGVMRVTIPAEPCVIDPPTVTNVVNNASNIDFTVMVEGINHGDKFTLNTDATERVYATPYNFSLPSSSFPFTLEATDVDNPLCKAQVIIEAPVALPSLAYHFTGEGYVSGTNIVGAVSGLVLTKVSGGAFNLPNWESSGKEAFNFYPNGGVYLNSSFAGQSLFGNGTTSGFGSISIISGRFRDTSNRSLFSVYSSSTDYFVIKQVGSVLRFERATDGNTTTFDITNGTTAFILGIRQAGTNIDIRFKPKGQAIQFYSHDMARPMTASAIRFGSNAAGGEKMWGEIGELRIYDASGTVENLNSIFNSIVSNYVGF